MADPEDFTMEEVYIHEEDDGWITLRQGCVADCYSFRVDKSGRCFRMGQVNPSTDEVEDEIHVCNPERFCELLGQAIAKVNEELGDG